MQALTRTAPAKRQTTPRLLLPVAKQSKTRPMLYFLLPVAKCRNRLSFQQFGQSLKNRSGVRENSKGTPTIRPYLPPGFTSNAIPAGSN